MPESHDVDMRNTLPDLGMHPLAIMQDCLFPVIPIVVQQELAIFGWRAFGESPIEGPDGTFDVRAEGLMRGIDVAESRGVHENGVPSGIGTVRGRQAIEKQICGEPGRVLELA